MSLTRPVLAWLFCGFICVELAPADDKTEKAPTLEGKWVVTKYEWNGEALPKKDWFTKSMEFKGDKVKIKEVDMLGTLVTNEYKLKIDAKAMPMEIDMDKDTQGSVGIYKFEKDKLIISSLSKLFPRPKDFVSKKDSGNVVLTLERAK